MVVATAVKPQRAFDADRVAHCEAQGWRAYYDRRWFDLLRLVVSMCHAQFHIPFPMSVVAAYYIAKASKAWAPVDHDLSTVRRYYFQFYRVARRYSGRSFDPGRAADLELRYNIDHRRLVGQPDKTAFIETMVALHGHLFGMTPAQARESAEWRVLANNTVDGITGRWSTDVEADWRQLEDQLRACYRSIARHLASAG